MRILHLTDLHVESRSQLEHLWNGAANRLPKVVDFVVISGDIANHATIEQYRIANKFLRKRILPLVKGNDVSRVVMVPGNHDVDWKSPIGPTFHQRANRRQFARNLQDFVDKREGSQFRFEIAHQGPIVQGFKKDGRYYSGRFAKFSAFVDAFYGDTLRLPHRKLNMLSREASHWSAHVFPDEQVAFLGISTCSNTDAYARGARLTAGPITQLKDHVAEYAKDCLLIGVWHHGLTSRRGDRDFLTTEEIGLLLNTGMHLGIHGHTHVDEQLDLWDIFRTHFPVIATGSFGAGSRHLPSGERNQFSVIEVNQTQVSWVTHERSPATNQWEPGGRYERHFAIHRRPLRRSTPRPTHAVRHQRSVKVCPQGVAHLTVNISGLTQRGSLLLASLSPGFTNSEPGVLEVRREGKQFSPTPQLVGSTRRYVLPSDYEEEYDQVDWDCYYSNAFALNSVDAKLGAPRSRALLSDLREDQDAFIHEVHFSADTLDLSLELPSNTIFDPSVIAQRPIPNGDSSIDWSDDPVEKERLARSLDLVDNRLRLTIARPTVGYRYGFRYKLKSDISAIPTDVTTFLDGVLSLCRSELPAIDLERSGRDDESGRHRESPPLHYQLTRAMHSLFRDALDSEQPEAVQFVAHLWSQKARQLLPCFGRFPVDEWGIGFPYGVGIAGHSFRFRRPTVYCKLEPTDSDTEATLRTARLLYSSPKIRVQSEPSWVIAVPLLLNRQMVPVGVLGFAGRTESRSADSAQQNRLADLAQRLTNAQSGDDETKKLDSLAELASMVLWLALSKFNQTAKAIYDDNWKDPPEPVRKRSAEAPSVG